TVDLRVGGRIDPEDLAALVSSLSKIGYRVSPRRGDLDGWRVVRYYALEDEQRARDVSDVLTQELSTLKCDPLSLELSRDRDYDSRSSDLEAWIDVNCPLRSRIPGRARGATSSPDPFVQNGTMTALIFKRAKEVDRR